MSFHPRDVTASLIFRLLSSHLRARRFVCEAISSSAALRLLPATLLAPFPVPARSSFRFRSSLTSQESLQASFFALFLCHCEVVVPLPKQSLQVASLRSQRRRKRPSDCFGASALVMTGEGVTARSPFRPPLLSLRGRLFVSEAVSLSFASLKNTRPLRRFAPRGDKVWVSLRGRRFALLLCHCEVVVSSPSSLDVWRTFHFRDIPKKWSCMTSLQQYFPERTPWGIYW